jgi:Uncharacterised nucleotidyltransferase
MRESLGCPGHYVTDQLSSSDLVSRVATHLATWPAARRQSHGFELLVGEPAQVHQARLLQARRVLVAEHLVQVIRPLTDRPLVLMKGLEVAQLYPACTQRPFRDVDVLMSHGRQLWDQLVAAGYVSDPKHSLDIDHHHLPSLIEPSGTVGLEIHGRPNLPRWAPIDVEFILETAEPSRTGIVGVSRPRDDVHALLIALHCWKGGFTRLRDLLDALLLDSVSAVPVEGTAKELGLGRMWRWTQRLAAAQLLGESSAATRVVGSVLLPRRFGVVDRNRTRLVAPYLVTSPWTATRAHAGDIRLGRQARSARARNPAD